MGFSLDNIFDGTAPYIAPDQYFIKAVSGMMQCFPWERFELFFESRPLIQVDAVDQVFLLRVLAVQELLCMDDENVLKWLKNQMYLFAFLSPQSKPKIPTTSLLSRFRGKLDDANLLEPFRKRCQDVILKNDGSLAMGVEACNYLDVFAPTFDFPNSNANSSEADPMNNSDILIEDKWVICPMCESSALHQIDTDDIKFGPEARCNQCSHQFKI